jgi:dynein heavy chain, axonemal
MPGVCSRDSREQRHAWCHLQDILEEMDPVLEPVLAKAFIKRGNQTLIKVGDKEVDYNPDFKLYITTKLSNPHYTPEISTKAMILNFSVKEDGLEAQLLNTVVKMERPDLDKQKNELVVSVAQGKRTQVRADS